ncbi:SRPBCC family protein [Halomicroarcula sp. GCM10025817]|uniref:SRPBCC family protein n=1 Tax=Haloarcula TaxID=2237 RepID=UPI0023E7FDC4|nr:SRPBCC family protein [Halomicroarcula sp. SYNS111]
MRTVEVTRTVPATVVAVDRGLSPAAIIESEGTFSVVEVTDHDDGTTTVSARASGLRATFTFEPLEDGYRYRQDGAAGPFEAMETTLTRDRADGGARLTARSSVSLGLPLPSVTDRLAGWKRRGELERLLETLAVELR